MLHFRSDSPNRKPPPILKRRDKKIIEETYDGWRLTVKESTVGMTVKRKQFRVSLHHDDLGMTKTLTGYWSKEAARQAAKDWIERDKSRRHVRRMQRINKVSDRPVN